MKAIILAGGLGTRLQEETVVKPKPMVEIGGQPILWHILKTYAAYGIDDFGIAAGYKAEVIKQYFLNYFYTHNNFTIHLGTGKIDAHHQDCEDWRVTVIDTGHNTMTGGRIKRMVPWVGRETFLLTYGDGVANIDIAALLAFHRSQGRLATVTAVRPPARFGGLHFNGDLITHFEEKPQIGEGWINGGYFVLEPEVAEFIEGDETVWERGPMERLAAEGQLAAYRHEGFWQCMDTLRDVQLLENLWSGGQAPWKIWD